MKAYFTDVVNGESRLVAADIDMPKPADDEILIKVRATALAAPNNDSLFNFIKFPPNI